MLIVKKNVISIIFKIPKIIEGVCISKSINDNNI